MNINLAKALIVSIAASLVSLLVQDTDVAKAVLSANQALDEQTYLKKDGSRWWKIVRRDGRLAAREAVDDTAAEAASRALSAASTTATYLRPYVSYPIGSWPEAVAIGDLNHDGLNDVALVTSFYFDPQNDYSLFVFLQNGAGGFQTRVRYPVGGRPESVDAGDVNGDGRDDVVVGREDGIFVLLQNATGTLNAGVNYSTTSSYKVRIGDFNSDGRMDVAGINWGSRSQVIVIFTQQANGTLALAAS